MPKRYKPSATQAMWAVLVSGIKNENPVKNRHKLIIGKVVRRRLRRPKVSMVYRAGMANKKLMTPQPIEAPSALNSDRFASTKTSEE